MKSEKNIVDSVNKALRSDHNATFMQMGYQGILYKVNIDGLNLIVKKANKSSFFTGRLNQNSLHHEYKIYKQLRGLKGIPKCYGLTEKGDLILELINGQTYREFQYELEGNDEFFNQLLALIQAMHSLGVSHGDLKRKDNIFVDEDKRPYLIDFGTAISNKNISWGNKILFAFIKKTDLNAWIKHKYRRDYQSINSKDLKYYSPTVVEDIYRSARILWYKIFRNN
ncbi:MAG: protein kinase family protein [Gammaproteobacteria bacterium]|nr:protein kinase family protein [Gammaproteobacteria bacterium]